MRLLPPVIVLLLSVTACADDEPRLEHSRWTAPELQGDEEFLLANDQSFFVYLQGEQSCVGTWEFSDSDFIEASCTDDNEERSYTLRHADDDVLVWVFDHDNGTTSEVIFEPAR